MKLRVFFGSQTGTAEEVAYDLARETARRMIEVEVSALDSFDLTEIISVELAVFIVATTGNGEPTDNMMKFWKAIMNRNLPANTFETMTFAVFGLGDSTYENFNVVARKLSVRLKQLGAEELIPKGLGDDMHDFSYEAEFHPWCEKLWLSLNRFFPELASTVPIQGLLPPLFKVSIISHSDFPFKKQIRVVDTVQLCSKFTNTHKICFEPGTFSPGDTLAVYPPNIISDVDRLLDRMGWQDSYLNLESNPQSVFKPDFRYPKNISLRELLLWYTDLNKPVSRYFIFMMSQFAEGMHKEKLSEMSEKNVEGRNEYHRYVVKEKRNAVEVLWDFGSVQGISLEYFIEAVGVLKPRNFSIASEPENIEIIVSTVKYRTPLGRDKLGLCSNYLADLQNGDFIYGEINKGRMKLPPAESPLILVGTGTGIAPLWSLLKTRCSNNCNQNLMFFGTRHPDHDYYFRKDLEELERNSQSKVFVTFSQYGNKYHIQHAILENWQIINEFIEAGSYVYVCGKAKNLSKSIRTIIARCLEKKISQQEAKDCVDKLVKTGKFYAENW